MRTVTENKQIKRLKRMLEINSNSTQANKAITEQIERLELLEEFEEGAQNRGKAQRLETMISEALNSGLRIGKVKKSARKTKTEKIMTTLNEKELSNDYPVYWDYLYKADGKLIRSDIQGTVLDLKRDLKSLGISCTVITNFDREGTQKLYEEVKEKLL